MLRRIGGTSRTIRERLNLSAAFVAKHLNISEDALTAIEDGTREVTSDELRKFSKLYGVCSDDFLDRHATNDADSSLHDLPELSDMDKKAIQDTMYFRTRYRSRSNQQHQHTHKK